MKKMTAALIGITIITLAAGNVAAQTSDKDIAFIPAKNHAAYISFVANNNFSSEDAMIAGNGGTAKTGTNTRSTKASLKAAKASNRAVQAFKLSYKDANASWSVAKDALIATFNKDDVRTTVVYQKNGKWFHTLTYLPGSKTPQDIADIIGDAFPRDEIKTTVQIEEGSTKFYIVQLEGKKTLKKVTVYNGETNVIEEFTKSK